MNLPDADATRLAQEAAARLKRSALIAQEAGRFAEMAKKIGSKTRPAIRLMAESERLQGEADALKAEAEQLLAQSQELLPTAEIIDSPLPPAKPSATDANVVDVEPVVAPPKPVAARIVVPVPKPPVATEKWGAGITPTPQISTPSAEAPKPAVTAPRPPQEIPRPVAEPAKPPVPRAEAPSPVLREVNRFNERPPEKPKPAAPAPKSAPPEAGFFKKIFGLGKTTAKPSVSAPATTRPATGTVKPVTQTAKPFEKSSPPVTPPAKVAEPMFEAPKAPAPAPAPKVPTPIPAPPRVEKPVPPPPIAPIPVVASPPPPPLPAAPKPIAPAPPLTRYVTCHCPQCDQGVEFDAAELTPDNCVIPCPNCGEEMKLSVP